MSNSYKKRVAQFIQNVGKQTAYIRQIASKDSFALDINLTFLQMIVDPIHENDSYDAYRSLEHGKNKYLAHHHFRYASSA